MTTPMTTPTMISALKEPDWKALAFDQPTPIVGMAPCPNLPRAVNPYQPDQAHKTIKDQLVEGKAAVGNAMKKIPGAGAAISGWDKVSSKVDSRYIAIGWGVGKAVGWGLLALKVHKLYAAGE